MTTYTCTATYTAPAPTFNVYVTGDSNDSTPCDLQVDTASDSGFTANLVTTTLNDQTDGATISFSVGPFVPGSTVYVRARAGDVGGAVWSAYTSTKTMVLPTKVGDACFYLSHNIGVTYTLGRNAAQEVSQNVGVIYVLSGNSVVYVFENIGTDLVPDKDGYQYVYLGDVNTQQPYPHLWSLVPWSGRPGDGVLILGEGMGVAQATFEGVVQILIGGTWENVPVVSWQRVAATADWNTPASAIEPGLANIDPEHMEIAIVVPEGAIPPGHQIRVRTTAP